jgi:hypothetical protein
VAVQKNRVSKRGLTIIPQYTGWVSAGLVRKHLGNPVLECAEEDYLRLCVDAVNRAIAYWRPDLAPPLFWRTAGPFSHHFSMAFLGGASKVSGRDPMIVLGATMYAVRLFQRKGSGSAEVAAYAEFGQGPPPVLDHDIAILLRVGRAHAPVVA